MKRAWFPLISIRKHQACTPADCIMMAIKHMTEHLFYLRLRSAKKPISIKAKSKTFKAKSKTKNIQ